jgi:hypothetical protein
MPLPILMKLSAAARTLLKTPAGRKAVEKGSTAVKKFLERHEQVINPHGLPAKKLAANTAKAAAAVAAAGTAGGTLGHAYDKYANESSRRRHGYKKGGVVKSSRKKSKSIDGIARKGKTRAKHR